MKLVGFDIDSIVGVALGVEYADGTWVNGDDNGFYVVIDIIFLRFILEFTKS